MSKSENQIDPNHIYLDIKFEKTSLDHEDPHSYFQTLLGKIYYTFPGESSPEAGDLSDWSEKLIGAFRLFYIDASSASDNHVPLFEVYDCDNESCEFFEDLINPKTNKFKPKVEKAIGEIASGLGNNTLLIDHLGLVPEYRGQNIGLHVLFHIIERFSLGACLIGIKPYPFKFNEIQMKGDEIYWFGDDDEYIPEPAEIKGLEKYYGKVGFKKIPGSNFMALATGYILEKI